MSVPAVILEGEISWTKIDRRLITAFARLSGDQNPIHTDKKRAQKFGLATNIAHGGLIFALLSAAVWKKHGDGAIIARGDFKFCRPVKVNDYIGFYFEEPVERFGLIEQKVTIFGHVIHDSLGIEIVAQNDAKLGELKLLIQAPTVSAKDTDAIHVQSELVPA